MTPSEFKAWFDGFTEALADAPTKAQWARIKDRVAEIDGRPVTREVFVDRYWRSYRDWRDWPQYASVSGVAQGPMWSNTIGANSLSASSTYNSTHAMGALGRADATALAS